MNPTDVERLVSAVWDSHRPATTKPCYEPNKPPGPLFAKFVSELGREVDSALRTTISMLGLAANKLDPDGRVSFWNQAKLSLRTTVLNHVALEIDAERLRLQRQGVQTEVLAGLVRSQLSSNLANVTAQLIAAAPAESPAILARVEQIREPPSVLVNAVAYLQTRYKKSTVMNRELRVRDTVLGYDMTVWAAIAHDPEAGVKQRMIVYERLDDLSMVEFLHGAFDKMIDEMEKVQIEFGNFNIAGTINTAQMPFAIKYVVYVGSSSVPTDYVVGAFAARGLLVEVVRDDEMHRTVFISYGGPDEMSAGKINGYLRNKGVQTWFFPHDATPGDKLHRVMSEGVNSHDRVLLICSKASLTRPGVLNEIERVLEREAREGGSDILIPVSLDQFVFSDWAPGRADLATQIRARVIGTFDPDSFADAVPNPELEKVVVALRRRADG